MVSKVLLRLIDEAIFPLVFLVLAKVTTAVFLLYWLGFEWQVNIFSLIPSLEVRQQQDLVLVNTYSNLAMFLVAILGLGWVLVKAHKLHETHISPKFVLKLLSWDLFGLIASSLEVYHQAAVWLAFLWLAVLLTLFHTYLGVNYLWAAIFSLVAGIAATWYVIADIEREVES